MPWLILLISAALMVTSLNLVMTFLASWLRLTVYSLPCSVFVLSVTFIISPAFTLVFFLAISSTAFSCATLTASVSSLPAPRLMILRRMVLPSVVPPTDNAPVAVAWELSAKVAPVGV